ncbi:cupin domain-containing protein [Aestuariispira ectoiniformans]|uniref:cupin domain-containing protein n=1 Tax=Aestuariispira ectoiniformans TaxID=2775080 RepID=UPI00223BF40A|nr:cupin domain-containing protein [Aestuariispira ectoiniformans]
MKEFPSVLNALDVKATTGSGYPGELSRICDGREKRRLGDLLGLSQFGVNLTTLQPGSGSSQRHWHEEEDEFIYVVSGVLTLINDEGEHELTAGMVAGFPAGHSDAHHLVNNSGEAASYLEIGTRSLNEVAHYPDVDLKAVKENGALQFLHKDGSTYSKDI